MAIANVLPGSALPPLAHLAVPVYSRINLTGGCDGAAMSGTVKVPSLG